MILQFGEGNFLRAFFNWMIDIANESGVIDQKVVVVSPRFGSGRAITQLQAQQGRCHVVLEGTVDGEPRREVHLLSCIADAFSPAQDFAKYQQYICSPELRFVVSNTTEAGIVYEPDDVRSDMPRTFPGKITSLLYKRFRHYAGDPTKGLIFLPCELIEDNGATLRRYVLQHAREAALGDDFIAWVRDCCIFCDTLVDRIVSGFPTGNVPEGLPFDDQLVDAGELYHLWVIGGDGYQTVQRELPLDKAGLNVVFVPSVKPFRDKKVRILNGSHTGMVPVAIPLGHETVREAFTDPRVSSFISAMMEREVIPAIGEDPEELRRFTASILERFYNPYIRHLLKSIALNSLSKWEARIYPTAKDYYAKTGRIADCGAFAFAALLSLYGPGSGFEPEDDSAAIGQIRAAWDSADLQATAARIVASGIFHADIEAEMPGFAAKAGAHLAAIRRDGMAAALDSLLASL